MKIHGHVPPMSPADAVRMTLVQSVMSLSPLLSTLLPDTALQIDFEDEWASVTGDLICMNVTLRSTRDILDEGEEYVTEPV